MSTDAYISRFKNVNITESVEYKNALVRMKMLSGKGGRPVPADENGLDALIEKSKLLTKSEEYGTSYIRLLC